VVSEKTKGNFGAIVFMLFIIGIFFMIIDEGIGIIFGIGLLLFLFVMIVGIITVMWSIAGSAKNIEEILENEYDFKDFVLECNYSAGIYQPTNQCRTSCDVLFTKNNFRLYTIM